MIGNESKEERMWGNVRVFIGEKCRKNRLNVEKIGWMNDEKRGWMMEKEVECRKIGWMLKNVEKIGWMNDEKKVEWWKGRCILECT